MGHRLLKWSLATVAALCLLLAILAAALARVDPNRWRGTIADHLSRHYGRQIRIDGPLEGHFLSLHPSFVAERVTIGNPPWSPPGTLALIGKLTVVLDLPLFGQAYVLRKLELDHAEIHFQRDAGAHANWLWKSPGILPGKGIPPIYSLRITDAHVRVDDDRRHLLFDGRLTTKDTQTAGMTAPLRIEAKGHLNGRDVTLSIEGDPLSGIARSTPYSFSVDARSSGSHLAGHGSISHPFDLRYLEGEFTASGADLKDLYYLAGVHLPNTGPYRLSGKFERRFTKFKLSDLVATTGESDAHATVASEMNERGNSHVDVDLRSKRLRIADLGLRAAGRAAGPPGTKPLVLPELEIRVDGIRRTDATIVFHAEELDAGRLSFHTASGKMSIDHGLVEVRQLSADLPDGKVTGHVTFDGKTDVPTAKVELTATNVRIGQLAKKDPTQPPLDGPLQAHLKLSGRGRSIHEIAADANGTITGSLAQGTMRASLAELTGIDLRGLGLMLTKNKEDTPVRCAVARFQAKQGTLTAQTLVIDTDPVLITGGGVIDLNTETLDLEVRGHPKQTRLFRLKAPILIEGTLRHPSFGVAKDERKFKLIDPGHGKDVDCTTLLAETKTGAPSLP